MSYYYDTPVANDYTQTNTWGRLSAVVFHAQGVSGYPQPDFAYEYNYNQAGRVIGNRMLATQGSSHVDLRGQYAWDNQGRMTSMTYPSGPVMTTQFDAMGRPSNMSETACVVTPGNPQCSNYTWTAGNATYGSGGQLLTVGGSGFNGTITASVNETRTYNNMLQLTHLVSSALGYQAPNTYTGGGVDMQYVYNTGHNNGRVAQTIDNTLGETVNYGYDYLHRLTAATATNGTWGEAYTYDGFGNLTGKTPTQGYAPAMTGSADSNATGGALNGQWDVEKRPMTQGVTQATPFYVYDPWGRRVWRQWYDTTYGTTNCEAYFYGATGQKLESYSCTYSATSLSATLQGINTYFAGKMLSEKGVFIATDRLGSVRGDSNGVSMSYFPWGEERGQGTTDGRTKFASYYRDMPGQDYANARYYSASSGSFWSPDPKGNGAADTAYASGMAASYTPGLGAARPDNPMSWNRYMYSLGDPINFFDPIGKDSCDADGTDCDDGDDPDCGNALSPCPADTGGGDVVFSTTVTSTPWVWPITVPDLSTLTDLLAGALAEIGTVAGTVGQTALGAVAVFALTPSTSGTDTLHTASGVPTPQELVGTCTLISTVVEPSTNSRNKGGTSIEQVYQCPDGSVWVVHTLKDKNGGTFDSPHIRKWPKQGQAK